VEHGNGGEAGIFSEHARAVAQVLQQGIEPGAGAGFADAFLYLLRAAELDASGAAGWFGRHTFANFLFGELIDEGVELVVEFAIITLLGENVSPEAFDPRNGGHQFTPRSSASGAKAPSDLLRSGTAKAVP